MPVSCFYKEECVLYLDVFHRIYNYDMSVVLVPASRTQHQTAQLSRPRKKPRREHKKSLRLFEVASLSFAELLRAAMQEKTFQKLLFWRIVADFFLENVLGA